MARLLLLAVLAIIAWRIVIGYWPWQRRQRVDAVAQARNLLGLRKNATLADIREAHRRLVARVHPDRGGLPEQVHAANAARDLLISQLDSPAKE